MAVVEKRTPQRDRTSTGPRHARPAASPAHGTEAEETPGSASARARAPQLPPPIILPQPPTDQEKYLYVKRRTWVLTLASLLSFPLLLLSQIELVERDHVFWIFAPFIVFGGLLFVLPLATDGIGRGFSLRAHRQLVESWCPARYPSVDIFLPVCGEPVTVLRNTWDHVKALADSYAGPLTVWVLDDSADPILKTLARDFGFAYASRPNRGWYKKSGNLLYGYLISEGDYVLLLDADFAPRADLLAETLPYLAAFPEIGILQTPQFFRVLDEQTWIERGAGAVQELFYRSIQTARARKGGATCVGTCAVYRRAALDDNKGMALSEHSEDLMTGFDLQCLGWQIRYVPLALSTGTCPDNIFAFMNQQYRWCSGTLSLMASRRFWRSKLPFYSRLCHVSGLVYYLYTAIFNFAIPAMSITILITAPELLKLKNTLFFLPVLVYAIFIVPLWHRSPYRLEAWAVRIVSGWAHTFALWDLLTGRRRGWHPSGASARRQDGRRRLWVALIGWNAAVSVIWASLAFWRLITMNSVNIMMIFALGLFDVAVIARVLIQPARSTHT
jgi:cellulose synthase (UDP-forming)